MFPTHSYSMTSKSHYINNTKMLLMLASTIRFSNHYQTPPTSSHEPVTTTQQVGLSAETTPNTGFVIPGPNNVPVPAHPTPTPPGAEIPARQYRRATSCDVPPMSTQHQHERLISWGAEQIRTSQITTASMT